MTARATSSGQELFIGRRVAVKLVVKLIVKLVELVVKASPGVTLQRSNELRQGLVVVKLAELAFALPSCKQ